MTEQEVQNLINQLDGIINNASYTVVQKETGINKILGKFLTEENVNSDSFEAQMQQINDTLANAKTRVEANYKSHKAMDDLVGGTPDPQTRKLKDLLDKLKDTSKTMGKTQARIIDAKNQEIDIDDYIETKKEELSDLKVDVKDKEKAKNDSKKDYYAIINNKNYKEREKIQYTRKVYAEYNKLISQLQSEITKVPQDANKINELKANIATQKAEILSDRCVKFDDKDMIKVTVNGAAKDYSLNQLLNENKSIKEFIDGTVEHVDGGTRTAATNLNTKENQSLTGFFSEIQTEPELASLKAKWNAKYPTATVLSDAQLTEIINEQRQEYGKAITEYKKVKNEMKTKKDSLKSLKKEQELIENIDNNASIDEVWGMKKAFNAQEKNELVNITNSRRSRYDFWRQNGSGRISSFFKSIFQKNKTAEAYKYMKVEEKKNEAKRKNELRNNKFRKELVNLARTREVNEADKEDIYRKIDENELDR